MESLATAKMDLNSTYLDELAARLLKVSWRNAHAGGVPGAGAMDWVESKLSGFMAQVSVGGTAALFSVVTGMKRKKGSVVVGAGVGGAVGQHDTVGAYRCVRIQGGEGIINV